MIVPIRVGIDVSNKAKTFNLRGLTFEEKLSAISEVMKKNSKILSRSEKQQKEQQERADAKIMDSLKLDILKTIKPMFEREPGTPFYESLERPIEVVITVERPYHKYLSDALKSPHLQVYDISEVEVLDDYVSLFSSEAPIFLRFKERRLL